uniref:Uncharacterized protein n=1 Tax=Arundo donax TaxID=35708 RepID=A0A0A8ZIN7_ARUDO
MSLCSVESHLVAIRLNADGKVLQVMILRIPDPPNWWKETMARYTWDPLNCHMLASLRAPKCNQDKLELLETC